MLWPNWGRLMDVLEASGGGARNRHDRASRVGSGEPDRDERSVRGTLGDLVSNQCGGGCARLARRPSRRREIRRLTVLKCESHLRTE